MKNTNTFLVTLAVLSLHAVPLSASEPIRPYTESGKSGQFSYAIYNNRWLAFKDCKALKGLTVPKSVTTIERGAFRGCEVEVTNGPESNQ